MHILPNEKKSPFYHTLSQCHNEKILKKKGK